jgi:RHS repeat-associated protein
LGLPVPGDLKLPRLAPRRPESGVLQERIDSLQQDGRLRRRQCLDLLQAAQHLYDGEGKRVQKTVGTSVTTYVYDASGQLAAEYATQSNASGLLYLTADTLGSTRLTTNSSGVAQECNDYFPFGEDIQQGIGGRSTCYPTGMYPGNPDIESIKFTGKERDAETGMDFFLARYYSSPQGRFTSQDEFKGGIVDAFTGQDIETNTALPYADITDPQTLNKYTYVRNSPLRYTDPDGHVFVADDVAEWALLASVGAAATYYATKLTQAIYEHYDSVQKANYQLPVTIQKSDSNRNQIRLAAKEPRLTARHSESFP